MIRFILYLVLWVMSVFVFGQSMKTEVLVLSTLHKGHQVNSKYTYDSIQNIIQRYQPNVLGVEIRAEDLKRDSEFLAKYYPQEMRQFLFQSDKISYYGFDWLGADIEGITMPENYFEEKSEIIKLRNKLKENHEVQEKIKILSHASDEKNKIALTSSPQEMLDGRYDAVNRVYYKQMMDLMGDTELKALPEFYLKRDEKIAENILKIIEANKGKRLLFLMGADHRSFTMDFLQEKLGNDVKYVTQF
jgi:pheromone shutdown protein TraB